MKKNPIARPMLCTLLCASVLVSLLGCAQKNRANATPPADAQQSPSSSAARTASSAPVDAHARLPLEKYDYIIGELKNYRDIGAQPLVDDENAYALTEAIYRYRDYHNALIFDAPFTDIAQADAALLVEIAASQSPHIDLYADAFADASPENPIRRFYETQREKGGTLSLLSYGEDVRRVAKSLFGDDYELPRQDGHSILYNETLDLYYLDAEGSAMSTVYPILTAVTPSESGDGSVTVEAVRMCYWDSYNAWSTPDGTWESGNDTKLDEVGAFVSDPQNKLPRYRFTLTPAGKGWRITGFSKAPV